jgi:hypothetical protein
MESFEYPHKVTGTQLVPEVKAERQQIRRYARDDKDRRGSGDLG